MKRLNLRQILLIIFCITVISILKNNFFNSIDDISNIEFVKMILIMWSDSQILNIIWLLPILLSTIIVGKKYYTKLCSFDVRFKNRKHYINKLLINIIISSFIINFLIMLFQLIILTNTSFILIISNIKVLKILLIYVVETMFINILVIIISLYIKKIMYSYIIVVIMMFLSLIIFINFSLNINSNYIPFINMYLNSNINIITIILIFLSLLLIKRKYIYSDILGGND